jgi:hypothetical protein
MEFDQGETRRINGVKNNHLDPTEQLVRRIAGLTAWKLRQSDHVRRLEEKARREQWLFLMTGVCAGVLAGAIVTYRIMYYSLYR